VVLSVEASFVDNAILLDYSTSKVAFEEPEIGSTDPSIPIHNNCMHDELHIGMPGDRGYSKDERHTRDERNAIPTTSRRRWAATELERFDLGTHDVNGYDGEVVDDVDEEEDASQADDGSMQIVEA
jgi:hypothetical protein